MTTALLLQLLVSLNSVDPTAAVELPSMAVMPIRSATLPETTVTVLDDALLAAVADLNAFKLVGQADIRAVLGLEETRQQLGCTDESCIAELAGALGTRYIFSTTGDIWEILSSSQRVSLTKLKQGRLPVTEFVPTMTHRHFSMLSMSSSKDFKTS